MTEREQASTQSDQIVKQIDSVGSPKDVEAAALSINRLMNEMKPNEFTALMEKVAHDERGGGMDIRLAHYDDKGNLNSVTFTNPFDAKGNPARDFNNVVAINRGSEKPDYHKISPLCSNEIAMTARKAVPQLCADYAKGWEGWKTIKGAETRRFWEDYNKRQREQ